MQQVLHCPQCKNTIHKTKNQYLCKYCDRIYPILEGIPCFVDQNRTFDGFDASSFTFLFKMEQRHFWHVGRKRIILDVLRRNINNLSECRMLEIGCGNGNILTYLEANGIDIEGGDIFIEGLRFCRQRSNSANLYLLDILSLPFHNNFEIIGIFDVLEHIENDMKALSEINLALKPGGNLILTVPAYQLLWSPFDEGVGHKRRYGLKDIRAKLENSGFVVKKISFYVFFLFPIIAAIRLITKALPVNNKKRKIETVLEANTIPVINGIFSALLKLEMMLMRYTNLPFGSSLLVLAEKKKNLDT
jgi:SAM-dependent methyltransferase